MRYKVYRMLDVLYSLELMDRTNYWEIDDAARDAWAAYHKRLKEIEDKNES